MTWGASDTVILERPGPDGVDREASHILRARACDASLGSILKGTADQQVTLALRSSGLRSRLGVMGKGHPVHAALAFERRVAGDPAHEIDPHHHAARRGLSLSVHAPTVKRGWSSVIETFNGNLLGT